MGQAKRGRGPTPDDLTFRIAWAHYIDGQSAVAIARSNRLDASTVRRRIHQARDQGLVHILVAPPLHRDDIDSLRIRLRAKYRLHDVHIVRGLDSVMKKRASPEKEAVLILCAKKAADYLSDSLADGMTLGVSWGVVNAYIAAFINPPRDLSTLTVVPTVGVMGYPSDARDSLQEAHVVAARIASSYAGMALALAAPAIVEEGLYDRLSDQPVIRKVRERLHAADIVVIPIGGARPDTSTLIRKGCITPEQFRAVLEHNTDVVGEHGGYFFDSKGNQVPNLGYCPMGVSIDHLKEMVASGRRVVVVAAADDARVVPLHAVLTGRVANVVVTDHITAQKLLMLR